VTLASPCPRCAGVQRSWAAGCLLCGGHGDVIVTGRIELRLPPGLESGRIVHARVASPIAETPLVLRMTIV
jgi:DnaJ-class molecular chaperone